MSNESMGYTELGNMKFNGEPAKKSRNMNANRIKKGGFAALVVVLIALLVFGITKIIKITGGSYDSAVETFVENVWTSRVNGGEVNESKWKKQYSEFMDETIEEWCDYFQDEYDDMYNECFSMFEYLLEDEKELYKVTYEVVDKEKLDADEIEEYQDRISSFAGYDEKVKVQAGYRFTVEINGNFKSKYKTLLAKETGMEADDFSALDFESNVDMIVLKCNGKTGVWKIDNDYIFEDSFY